MEKQEGEVFYNLLDEPWIKVKLKSNETIKWSILEVFQKAHEAQGLAGEIPTQDIAIMRILLAVMHGVFVTDDIEDFDDAAARWAELWGMKKFPYEIVMKYLEKYRERFWLFHPTQPFFQSANIKDKMAEYKAGKGKKNSGEEKYKTVARLVGDLFQSDNLQRLFPGRTGINQNVLSYDEAARWLIHLNGFDDDSAKNPTPKGVGYLGKLGLVYLQGNNLFETLMLNFVLADQNDEIFDDNKSDSAYWEKPVCEDIERRIAQPRSQKDLLTMQSRRILLKRENGLVTGYLLTMGDYVENGESLKNEMMTILGKDDDKGIYPRKHSREKQMWRDFASLMGMMSDGSFLQPGVVHWLKAIREKHTDIKQVKLVVTGGCYTLKGAGWQIEEYVSDSLAVNAALVDNLRQIWVKEIVSSLAIVDRAIGALGRLAMSIADAAGDSDENRKKAMAKGARETGYYNLDNIFRTWLISINPEHDELEEKIREWLDTARKRIMFLGEEMLERCPISAITSNVPTESGKNGNAVQAFMKFRIDVISCFK